MARFPRRARLLRPKDYDAAFKQGRRNNERWLAAVSARNQIGHSRLGLAVSKKSVPLASDRNRIKRRIRESFRNHQHRFGAIDIIMVTRPGASQASAADLNRNLERLWKRIEALSAASSSS